MRKVWLVALLLVPSVLAANGDLEATAILPMQVTGQTVQEDEGHFLLQGDEGTASFQFDGDSGTLTRVVHRAFGYIRQDDPQAGVLWHQQVREIPVDLTDATVILNERLEEFTLLAEGDLTRQSDASFAGILQEPLRVQTSSSVDWQVALQMGQIPEEYTHVFDAGLYQSLTSAGEVAAEQFTGTLGGATVTVVTPERQFQLEANFRVERQPGSIYNPLDDTWVGSGDHEEFVLEVHRIDAVGQFQASYDNVAGYLITEAGNYQITGETVLPKATGTLTLDDEVHTFTNQDLTIGGAYQLTMSDGNPATVTGQGDFTKVSYGNVDASYDWANVAAAVGIGTLVLAGAAWLLGQAKGVALLGGYARVQGEKILEHPGRQMVYDLVKANPGNNFQELQDKVDFGSSTLNYHLRVLEKNEYVTRVKDGRYVRFFDRHNGEYSAGRKTALSTLQNQTTARIAQHIIAYPGTPQCDLAQRFGIAPSTVSWHIRRLSDAGLVDRARDNHYTRYYMGEAWSSLPSQELQRFGVA